MLYRVLAVVIGYCFGLFQTAYLLGRRKGIDIRREGSGNAGTTNALRTMGVRAGLIVMAGDILKCILAVLTVWLLAGRAHPEIDYLLRVWTGLGCIAGHNYPFYMGFRGGKGMACTAGLINSISLVLTGIGLALFFGLLALTHYVSLCSLSVGVMFFIGTVVMGQTGHFHMAQPQLTEMYIVTAVIVAEMFFRHRENIKRLLRGTERKTYILKGAKNK